MPSLRCASHQVFIINCGTTQSSICLAGQAALAFGIFITWSRNSLPINAAWQICLCPYRKAVILAIEYVDTGITTFSSEADRRPSRTWSCSGHVSLYGKRPRLPLHSKATVQFLREILKQWRGSAITNNRELASSECDNDKSFLLQLLFIGLLQYGSPLKHRHHLYWLRWLSYCTALTFDDVPQPSP